MKKKLLITLIISLSVIASSAFADQDPNLVDTETEVIKSIEMLGNWMFSILLALAVITLLYAAFVYLTAGGDTEKVSKGRKILLYAIAAIAIATVSKGVPTVIKSLLVKE